MQKSFFGTIIDKYDYGEGGFNKSSKKNGYWKEYTREGIYINGQKNSIWKIYEYNDLENSKNAL